MPRLFALFILLAGIGSPVATVSADEIKTARVAILAHRGVDVAIRQWTPTMDYLRIQVPGYEFEIVPVDNDTIEAVIDSGTIDFVLTNPGSYVRLEHDRNIYRIATLIRRQPSGAQPRFGAAIFTRADHPDINTLQDLKGKVFMAIHPKGFGGWQMAWREIRDAGIDPYTDFEELLFSGFPQKRAIDAVLAGDADAGTVRTGQIERLVAKGTLNRDDLRILNSQDVPGFRDQLSTRLYPEWPLAITMHADRELAANVLRALLDLREGAYELEFAGITGWTIPHDYGEVHELLKTLHVAPYDDRGEITLLDVISYYWPWIVSLGLLMALLLLFYNWRMTRLIYESRDSLDNTLQSIGDAVITTDRDGRIEFVNPAAIRLCSMEPEEIRGQFYFQLFSLTYDSNDEPVRNLVRAALEKDEPYTLSESVNLKVDDTESYSVKLTVAPVHNGTRQGVGAVLVLHDVTDMQLMARQLRYQATHDPLTDLFNRREFEQALIQSISRIGRYTENAVLLYMDLDNFKVVNDTCGHAAGDELLKEIAAILKGRLRDSDILARLGGDEFGAVLVQCDLDAATGIADEIRDAVHGHRYYWGNQSFTIGVSIGMVPLEGDTDMSEALRHADAACYVAKEHGRNRSHIYKADDEHLIQRHGEMEWVQKLGDAFEENRFELYCQPIVPITENRDEPPHHELLIRMRSQSGELEPPAVFLGVAERYNLMPTIDRWVIRTAFMNFKNLPERVINGGININISGQTIGDSLFQQFVFDQLDRYLIPPEAICFEITETETIGRFDSAIKFITELRKRGCRFGLDDFGTGVSTFSYLRTLPLDYLKIDGSFIKGIERDEVMQAIVESINHVGHVLELRTVAEFVENEHVLDMLKDMGVDYAQGYALSKPFPFRDLFKKSVFDDT
jgi:diguanylate cyclase (GGDEF)-like protein/PAS domain S-box-containing protein